MAKYTVPARLATMHPIQAEERPSKIRKLNNSSPAPIPHTGIAADVPSLAANFVQPSADDGDDKGSTTHSTQIENVENELSDDNRGENQAENEVLNIMRGDAEVESTSAAPKLSKNALKKLKRREEWEANRDQRKTIRKEKEKAKKVRKREERRANRAAGIATPGEVAWGQAASVKPSSGAQTKSIVKPRQRAVQLPITVIIDCSWDDYMMEKEIVSMTNQLTRCYSDNYKANFRAHLAISSFGARLKDRFDSVLRRQYEGWKGVRFMEEDLTAVAAKAATWTDPEARGGLLKGQFCKYEGQETALRQEPEVVYLSSDSEETLTELKPYGVYIIGGLIDKNRYKGASYKKAQELGIRTAKLPIGDYMKMATRSVLTINHVYEIMLNWLETGDWATAFGAVIPKRKGGVLKDGVKSDGEDEAEVEGEEEEYEEEEDKNERDAAELLAKTDDEQSETQVVTEQTTLAEVRQPSEAAD